MIQTYTTGGSKSVMNVVRSKPASNLVSGFFPAPQRDKIKSAVVISRGPAGMTHRPVRYESQSILETHRMRKKNWVGTPYENRFAITKKHKKSVALADQLTNKTATIRRVSL